VSNISGPRIKLLAATACLLSPVAVLADGAATDSDMVGDQQYPRGDNSVDNRDEKLT